MLTDSLSVVDVVIHESLWVKKLPSIEEISQKTIERVIQFVAPFAQSIEVCVVLTSDEESQQLNNAYRKKDRPTNVLSFGFLTEPLNEKDYTRSVKKGCPLLLGDLILSLKTVEKEADEQKKSLEDHVRHLIVHGTLHLLGYDHIHEEDASLMESKEVDILREFGILNPYLIQDSSDV